MLCLIMVKMSKIWKNTPNDIVVYIIDFIDEPIIYCSICDQYKPYPHYHSQCHDFQSCLKKHMTREVNFLGAIFVLFLFCVSVYLKR